MQPQGKKRGPKAKRPLVELCELDKYHEYLGELPAEEEDDESKNEEIPLREHDTYYHHSSSMYNS